MEGIRAALRAADSVAPKTALTEAALKHFEKKNPRDLIVAFYGTEEPDVAGFSRCVADCASEGDAVAEAILLDAAEHLSRYASVLLEKCDADLVGVWGSVLCKNATVRQAFESGIKEKFPHVQIGEPAICAELAAALYAVKQEKESACK